MFIEKLVLPALAMFVFIWFLGTHRYPLPNNKTIPKSSVQTASTTPPLVFESKATSTPIKKSIATTTKSKKTTPKPVETQKISIATAKIPIVPPEPLPDFEIINTFARKAIVNILCTTKGGELSPTSGTGVIINQNGIVLTNAHIGQYFLLRDFRQKDFVECILRDGSPAYPRYHVELVYISPTWVADNKSLLKEQNPKGTGENDFAFLRITERIDKTNLPKQNGVLNFPYIIPNVREVINKGEPVILVSYPAGFLGGISILQDLSVTSAVTDIQEIFTFKENTVDVIAVGGTVLSQKGSSGGAVVDKYSSLIGIISTSSEGDSTSERDLHAITVAYINRDLQKELGINMNAFLSQDLSNFAKIFQSTTAPILTKIITDELNKNQ